MIINPLDNVEVREDGHKYALRAIAAGENVIKYGMPIGHATVAIAAGEHVHVHNVKTNLGDVLEYAYDPSFAEVARVESPTIRAYRHPDGRVGIRNDLWVVPLVGCVNRLAERFANPFAHHKLTSIALNSAAKWKARCLPVVADYYRMYGKLPERMMLGYDAIARHFDNVK